ncbi:HU family DNA-binding protein [Mycoplasma sp. 1012]
MKRKEILVELSQRTKLNIRYCDLFLDSFINLVMEKLNEEEEILIPKFGTFCITTQKARETIYWKTKEKYMVEPKKIPKFKPAKHFKESILNNIK